MRLGNNRSRRVIMPSNDYIPEKDAHFSLWAQAFATGITNNPAMYMLTPAQALSIQTSLKPRRPT